MVPSGAVYMIITVCGRAYVGPCMVAPGGYIAIGGLGSGNHSPLAMFSTTGLCLLNVSHCYNQLLLEFPLGRLYPPSTPLLNPGTLVREHNGEFQLK